MPGEHPGLLISLRFRTTTPGIYSHCDGCKTCIGKFKKKKTKTSQPKKTLNKTTKHYKPSLTKDSPVLIFHAQTNSPSENHYRKSLNPRSLFFHGFPSGPL